MSRSNPTAVNPAKRFFKWSGSDGTLKWYDKENQKEVVVKIPFNFLVLDQLATITGYCEQDGSNYWSNEVRSVAKDELTVRTSKGIKQVGLYKDLADVRSKGAKYAKSVYIAYYDGNDLVLGNIKCAGAALTAWIEFGNKVNANLGKISLTGNEEAKKGATTYYTPVFRWGNATTEEDTKSITLDKELQQYLNQYLSAAHFDKANQEPVIQDDVIEDIGDEPINLDDIPF